MANKVDNIDALLRDDLDREVKVPEAEAKSEPAAEDAAESIPEPAENAENEKQSGQMSYEDAIKAATARYQSAIEEETRRLAGLDEKDAPKAEPEADKADESAVSETEPESEETAEPKGPTTADDTEDYTREANRDPGLSYIDTEIEGSNLRHYEGYLGTFDYDPEQFELQIAKTEANQYGPASEREVLRYVGKEVDGNKIHIPEGIKNGEMMFAETNIVTPPKLPESLESGLGMFMGCKNLTRPNDHFPAALKEAPFMYADCKNMTFGRIVIPGTCKNIDYMFSDCEKLRQVPVMAPGVESANGAFANCKSLQTVPHIPDSLKQASDITFGCDGMDKAKDKQAQETSVKAREAFEKSLDKKGFLSHVGSMFSAMMQCHAMRKMGYGIIMAPVMTHAFRKNGTFGTDFSGGMAALARTSSSRGMNMLAMSMQRNSVKKQMSREQERQQRLEQWDRVNTLYNAGFNFNNNLKRVSAQASKDVKRDLFLRLPRMETSELAIYRESHGHESALQAQEEVINIMAMSGQAGVNDKKMWAKWYMDNLSDKAAYLSEAQAAIQSNKGYTSTQKNEARQGLRIMRDVTMEPIVESMQRMQKEHQLFNEGDQRTIDRMMAQVTGKSVFGTDARTPQNAPQRSSVMDDVKFTKAAPQAAPSKDDVHERRVNQAEEISKDVEQRQNDGDQFDYGG